MHPAAIAPALFWLEMIYTRPWGSAMNIEPWDRRLRRKAEYVANYLDSLTPAERAEVLRETETIWRDRLLASQQTETAAEDEEEELLAAVSFWFGQVFRQLSSDRRQAVIDQLTQI